MLFTVIVVIIVIILLVLFMSKPHNARKKEWDNFIAGKLFAHRGLFNNESDHPENSLPAFELAVENKYGIELDVQLTKDKQLVVHHDLSLKRSTGKDLKVNQLTYEEFQDLPLFNSKETIPLFTDVLKVIDGKVPLIVEIKVNYDYLETTIKTNEILNSYSGNYCVESFNPLAVKWYRQHRPDIIRGQLSTDYFKDHMKTNVLIKVLMTNYLSNFLTRPDFVADNFKFANRFGYKLQHSFWHANTICWTPKNESDLKDAQNNFDACIFDSFDPRK